MRVSLLSEDAPLLVATDTFVDVPYTADPAYPFTVNNGTYDEVARVFTVPASTLYTIVYGCSPVIEAAAGYPQELEFPVYWNLVMVVNGNVYKESWGVFYRYDPQTMIKSVEDNFSGPLVAGDQVQFRYRQILDSALPRLIRFLVTGTELMIDYA